MWIDRDLYEVFKPYSGLEAAVLLGPRQVGKSSLLAKIQPDPAAFIALDDLQLRTLAQRDPAMLLASRPVPTILDEFQYAPQILPQIKLIIDKARRSSFDNAELNVSPRYFLSGSNQIDVERALRESLAGRATFFYLHGLSVHEVLRAHQSLTLDNIMFRGGFPDLYRRQELDPISYLNDYLSTFVEKDIARSAGIEKLNEFLTVMRLAAARVGNLVDYSSLGRDAGVASKTVADWISILERARIVMLLRPYANNLNSRLIKTPKIYFIDSGLAARLQGHQFSQSVINSPQSGTLFENLVVSEVIKARDHLRLDLQLWFLRTKDGEEVDLLIQSGQRKLLIEIKLAIQGVSKVQVPTSLQRYVDESTPLWVVSFGGVNQALGDECYQVPIAQLTTKLREYFS